MSPMNYNGRVQSLRRPHLLGLGLLFATALVRCSSFSSDPGVSAGDADALPDSTGVADALPDSTGVTDAVPDRTGVACGRTDVECSVGANCCVGSGRATCAVNCAAADAGVYFYECGRPSDCTGEKVCCMHSAGCGSNIIGSTCLPSANCSLCGAAGGLNDLGCDPKRSGECPPTKTCSVDLNGLPYTVCTR